MTTRSEKLEESYAKQTKALRKLAEIEQQIFDLEGSYLEGASLKLRAARTVSPTAGHRQREAPGAVLQRRGARLSWPGASLTLSCMCSAAGLGQRPHAQGAEARLAARAPEAEVLRGGAARALAD